jgi:predicted transcriptional regulator
LCSLAFKENVYAILESQFDLEAQEELKKWIVQIYMCKNKSKPDLTADDR